MSNQPLNVDQLPEPGDRYVLEDVIGTGIWAKVHRAIDTQTAGKVVAIKVQRYEPEQQAYIQEEYRVLRDFSSHPNLPDFHGVYRQPSGDDRADEIWFVLEVRFGGLLIGGLIKLETAVQ